MVGAWTALAGVVKPAVSLARTSFKLFCDPTARYPVLAPSYKYLQNAPCEESSSLADKYRSGGAFLNGNKRSGKAQLLSVANELGAWLKSHSWKIRGVLM